MYHKIPIQKLSHAQILKLLKGERIRVKHGDHHTIHASAEQHKKIMSAHKKGKGCCIMLDPYQQGMPEHLALNTKKGKGWLTDTLKEVAKEAAPHIIDWAGRKAKKYVEGMGAVKMGDGMAFAEHAVKTKRPSRVPKKRGRPAKGKGFTGANQTNPAAATFNLLPASAQKAVDTGLKKILGVSSPSASKPVTFVAPKSTAAADARLRAASDARAAAMSEQSYLRQTYPNLNANQIQLLYTAKQPGFLESHPNFLNDKPIIRKLMGRGKKGKKGKKALGIHLPSAEDSSMHMHPYVHKPDGCSSGGALYPAGYKDKDGSGAHKKKRGRPSKKGKGALGALLGDVLGGVIGNAAGGEKGKKIGSTLGALGGEFLPF